MVEVKVVKKYNPRTRALEPEEHPFDVGVLFANRVTATASGELSLGTFSVPTGKIAIITGVKCISSSADTWFEFRGDITDYTYLATAGENALLGAPDKPIWTLDEGQSVEAVVINAQSGVTYSVAIYGRFRDKVFKGLTP